MKQIVHMRREMFVNDFGPEICVEWQKFNACNRKCIELLYISNSLSSYMTNSIEMWHHVWTSGSNLPSDCLNLCYNFVEIWLDDSIVWGLINIREYRRFLSSNKCVRTCITWTIGDTISIELIIYEWVEHCICFTRRTARIQCSVFMQCLNGWFHFSCDSRKTASITDRWSISV